MMPLYYHCPRCQSLQVKELERSVYCPRCDLNFDKKFLKLLEDEDILANEELEGTIEVFVENANDNDELNLFP